MSASSLSLSQRNWEQQINQETFLSEDSVQSAEQLKKWCVQHAVNLSEAQGATILMHLMRLANEHCVRWLLSCAEASQIIEKRDVMGFSVMDHLLNSKNTPAKITACAKLIIEAGYDLKEAKDCKQTHKIGPIGALNTLITASGANNKEDEERLQQLVLPIGKVYIYAILHMETLAILNDYTKYSKVNEAFEAIVDWPKTRLLHLAYKQQKSTVFATLPIEVLRYLQVTLFAHFDYEIVDSMQIDKM